MTTPTLAMSDEGRDWLKRVAFKVPADRSGYRALFVTRFVELKVFRRSRVDLMRSLPVLLVFMCERLRAWRCSMSATVRLASLIMVVLTAVVTAAPAQVQRRPPGGQTATVKIDASVQVGSGRYASAANGRCEYASKASIYNVAAEMYRIEQNGDNGSLTLTVWKPTDGSNTMMNLSIATGTTREVVQTVTGQPTQGSGTVAVERSGAGGTFRIDAKSQKGVPLAGTISCGAFTPAIAEGGD